MAQTGYTPILIYSSSTTSNAPAAGNLTNSTLGSELAINITDGKLFYKDNANAVQVIGWKTTPTTAGGTGLTSYAAGDLLYYASGTTLSKLAIGASTTILTSSGTAPQWSAASGITVGTATNIAGGAAGSVPYQTGAGATSLLAIGTAYYQLGVNAGGTAPAWQPSATSVLTTQGDLLYASAANTLARLAKNTTATRYLSNTGTSNNPAWAQVDLTNGVTGTLPTGNGGTGLTSFTANGLVYASSTSALATSASLTWNGTVFAIGAAGNAFSFTSTTSSTAYNAAQYSNFGGSIYWGVDNSAGTAFNGLAYAGVIGTSNATAFEIFTNNVVRMTYGATGDVTVNTGNLIQGTAAKGINFTANTAAAGMTSQLLNWYEEGTWTPVLSATTTPPTVSYSNRTARYTRVGRLVTISLWMNMSSQSGGSGTAEITGLPFTSANLSGANVSAVVVANYQNVDPGAGNVFTPYVLDNSTTIRFGYSGQAGGGYGDLAIGSIGASNITFTLTASYII